MMSYCVVGIYESFEQASKAVQEYERQVKEGKLLVVANGDLEQATVAHQVLSKTPAEAVHLNGPTGVDAPASNGT